jgi:hypothetical protein
MPFKDLNEEQFVKIFKDILDLDVHRGPLESDRVVEVIKLKILFEIANELRNLNRRLQDGIYFENTEELQERVKAEVISALKNNPKQGEKQSNV